MFYLFHMVIALAMLLHTVHGNDLNDQKLFSQLASRSITKQNFNLVINEPEMGTLVMYSAPWCGHCKRMLPIWSELSSSHNEQKKFIIAKVDCTIDIELCSNEDILGYPTFVFYKKGSSIGIRFNENQLTKEAFELFMFNQAYKKNDEVVNKEVTVLTAQNFESTISKGFHFIKFFAPWCGHCKSMAQSWKDLVLSNPKVLISEVDCTVSNDICRRAGVNGYPTLVFYNDGQMINKYKGLRNIDGFKNFMTENVNRIEHNNAVNSGLKTTKEDVPVVKVETPSKVYKITSDNHLEAFQRRGLLFVKFFTPWCGHCKAMEPVWKEVADKYTVFRKVVIAECDCTQHPGVCQRYGRVQGYPTILLFENGQFMMKYNLKREMESFSRFLDPQVARFGKDEL